MTCRPHQSLRIGCPTTTSAKRRNVCEASIGPKPIAFAASSTRDFGELNVAVRTRTVFRSRAAGGGGEAGAGRVVVDQVFVQHDRRGPAAAEDLVAAAVAVEQLPSAPVEEIGKFCRKHGRKNCGTGNLLDASTIER